MERAARSIEIEIGDEKQPDLFYPQFKTKHWQNECNFSIRLKDDDYAGGKVKRVGETIEWERAGRTARFYELSGFEDGGVEFEVEFADKPPTNVVEFTLQTKEFDFHYQPALTQAEVDAGFQRPDNVVGSFAVYHRSRRDNLVGGKEYRAGKAFHIYRPQARDAVGRVTWCEMRIDGGLLTVTVPQSFLDAATYPLIVDPTIGYTSAGASSGVGPANEIVGSQLNTTASVNGSVQSVSFYGWSGAGAPRMKGVVVDSSFNILTNGITPEAVIAASPAAWQTATYSTRPAVASGGTYYPGFTTNDNYDYYYDSTATNDSFVDNSNSFASPTNPTDKANNTTKRSIYATYVGVEQEGFRFRNDNGSESTATWLAAQDANVTQPTLTNTRLRVLVNASGDPDASQYQLEYKKSTDGSYRRLLSQNAFPAVAASNTTAGTTLAGGVSLNMPSGIASGDLLIAFCTNDNPGATNMGISGWTQVSAAAYTGDVVKHAIFAKIAAGGDTGTLTGASQDFSAVVVRVTGHGVSDVATDVKAGTTALTSGSAPAPPSLNAGSSKRWLWLESFGADDDDDTATYWSTNYTGVAQIESASSTSSCLTAVAYRQNETQTETPGAMAMAASEEALAQTLAVPPYEERFLLAASANITASGENTTAQLSAPSGKSTSDFVAGRIQDDENPADAVNVTGDDYTEMEWCLQATASAVNGEAYDFRVTVAGTALDTYTVTPQWTIGTPAAPDSTVTTPASPGGGVAYSGGGGFSF